MINEPEKNEEAIRKMVHHRVSRALQLTGILSKLRAERNNLETFRGRFPEHENKLVRLDVGCDSSDAMAVHRLLVEALQTAPEA